MRMKKNSIKPRSATRERRAPVSCRGDEDRDRFRDHFSILAENLPDGVLVSRGAILWCNDAACKILGYEKNELAGKGPDFFLPEGNTGDQVERVYRAANEGGYFRGVTRVKRKDGKIIDVEYTITRIPGKEPFEYVTSCRDVTEQRRIERVLRESEQKYRNIVELAPDAIITIDLKGRVTSCNSAFTSLTGYSRDQIIGKYITELPTVRIEDTLLYSKGLASVVRGQVPRPIIEFAWVHKDGSRRLGEARVSLMKVGDEEVGIQVIAADITQRKLHEQALRDAHDELETRVKERTSDLARANEQLSREVLDRKNAETALRQSEQLYSALLSNLTDALFLFQDDRITWCNSTASHLFGYSREELIGKGADFFCIGVGNLKEFARTVTDAGNGGTARRVMRFVRKDGNTADIEYSLSRIPGKDPVQTIIVARDVTERRRAEEAVREAERRYRAIFDNRLLMVYVFDEDGTFLDANASALEKLGYSQKDLGKVSFSDLLSPSILQPAITGITEMLRHGHMQHGMEYPLRGKGGNTVWVETFVIPLERTSKGFVGLGIAQDITERKRVEDALRESEHNYSALVSNLGDAIFRYRDGELDWWNDKIEEITGYTREELGQQEVQFFMPPELDLRAMSRAVGKGLEEKDVFRGVSKAIRKDGTVLDIEYSTSLVPGKDPVELVGIVRDVTERNRMQAALKESEENYRLLFESTFDAIVVVDAETMKIVFGNRRAAQLFGFGSVGEGIGANILDFVHPEDREEIARGLLEELYVLERRKKYEIRAYTVDGGEMWIRALATRIEFQGKPAALVSVRDVTRHKIEEEEKRRLEEQLQLAGRLAAVGELAAGVAHELNNPLAAIQAYAQFLVARKDLEETLRHDLETVHSEALRASRIIRNLLSFSRASKPEKKMISLNGVLERSLELHEYRMRGNNLQFRKELDARLPEVMADSHQIQQVFVNIITNAEQAMVGSRKGGMLTVRTEKVQDRVRISFADDGPGIREEDLKRVFDPFFTTKDVGKGTGLGLSICYGIITEHQGTIRVSSKVGEGTTFNIELPLPEAQQ
ncbi:MAG: PAS domain S-box protein [Dehalococcoidia bacterium]|nr:PAS domain S-box protein [Dehalococcoidia bacterium]